MLDGLQARYLEKDMAFSPKASRIRCMPHTIHLAVIKVCDLFSSKCICYRLICGQLLEAIGVFSKKDGKRSMAFGGNYQDDVLVRADDSDDILHEDEDQEENVIEAVSKVRYIHPTGHWCCRPVAMHGQVG